MEANRQDLVQKIASNDIKIDNCLDTLTKQMVLIQSLRQDVTTALEKVIEAQDNAIKIMETGTKMLQSTNIDTGFHIKKFRPLGCDEEFICYVPKSPTDSK